MNDIKFRAWLKESKQMIQVYDISWNKEAINTEGVWRYFNEFELMQYTGLKDKNGKEIYEGDIISRENTYENNCVVKWDDESCGFTLNYIYFDESYNMNEFWDDFEVIGNIYENKDLLKEEE